MGNEWMDTYGSSHVPSLLCHGLLLLSPEQPRRDREWCGSEARAWSPSGAPGASHSTGCGPKYS